jgi:hypothetical protein
MRNCHVRRLTIGAPNASAARRGAQFIEDGLRTAGLPGESSRLVIVRRLDLGVLPPATGGSASVAQRIEAALAELPGCAVAAAGAAAAAADAVYFADEIEPCVLLAVHAARGQPPSGWFWPRAVRGWRSGGTAAEAVRCALQAAAQLGSGPDGAVQVVAALLAAGLLDRALEALRQEDGPALLAQCRWQAAAGPRGGEHAQPHADPLGPAAEAGGTAQAAQLARWSIRWGAGDARTLWLAASLLAAEQPALAGDPALEARAEAWLRRVHGGQAQTTRTGGLELTSSHAPARPGSTGRQAPSAAQENRAAANALAAPAAKVSGDRPSGTAPPGAAAAHDRHTEAPPAAASSRAGSADTASGAEPRTEPLAESVLWWRGLPLYRTEAAGIWLLLPLLRELGLAAYLREHSELAVAGLGWGVLAAAARRLAVPVEDPLWRELAPPRTPAGDSAELMRAAGAWCDQVETWCAERATLSLADIVLRTGWLYTTRTHVDLFFDLGAVDLRVRRLGLDLDPGWVPWLGRVVTFYYEAGMATWATQLGG